MKDFLIPEIMPLPGRPRPQNVAPPPTDSQLRRQAPLGLQRAESRSRQCLAESNNYPPIPKTPTTFRAGSASHTTAPISPSIDRLSGSILVRDPLSRPTAPLRAEGAARPIIKTDAHDLSSELRHPSPAPGSANPLERSTLSPSQRLAQRRPAQTRDRNGKEAYVTYVVNPVRPRS